MSSVSPNYQITIILIAETRLAGDEGPDIGHRGSASFKHGAKKEKKMLHFIRIRNVALVPK